MSQERKKHLEEARQKEIAKHMAIFNNAMISPKLKESSKRRLIELNVLDESGFFTNGEKALV